MLRFAAPLAWLAFGAAFAFLGDSLFLILAGWFVFFIGLLMLAVRGYHAAAGETTPNRD